MGVSFRLVAAFLIPLLTPLCLVAATAPQATAQGVLRRGNASEPASLDPQRTRDVYESNIVRDLFEGLIAYDAAGRARPGCAERWTISPDGRRYVFFLRAGLVWSDGAPLVADDFAAGLRRALAPQTAAEAASLLYPITGAEAVNTGQAPPEALGVRALDERTLEITLTAPTPYFIELLTHAIATPAPRHAIARWGKDWVKPGKMVSNGAFMLAEWALQDYILLVKNLRFHAAASVALEKIYYTPTPNADSALKQFRNGELDITLGFPRSRLDWLRRTMPGAVHLAPALSLRYLTLNTTRPPLNDRRVRRALSLAIDRRLFAEKIVRSGAPPAWNIVPPGIANYTDPPKLAEATWPLEERHKAARALLAQAGYGPENPLRLTLSYATSLDAKRMVLFIAWSWRKIGVQTSFLNMETKVFFSTLSARDFTIAPIGWVADFNDPANFLYLLQSTTVANNYAGFANPRFDDLMARAARTLDLGVRAGLMRRAEAIALEEMPIIPLTFGVSRYLIAPRVTGWIDNTADAHPSRYLRITREAP